METLRMILAWPVLAAVIMFAFWQFAKWLKRNLKNEDEYERCYKTIGLDIDNAPLTEWWYDFITNELTILGQMKWKNPEKTHVLSCKFWRKFVKIRLRRFIDDKETLKYIESDWVIKN